MNGVWEWSSVVVLAALAVGTLQYLMPTSSMGKVTWLVAETLVIYGVLLPMGCLVQQFGVQAFAQGEGTAAPNRQYQGTVSQQTAEAAQVATRTVVIATLSEKGIQCKNVALNMDTSKDGRISITKVFVSLDRGESGKLQEAKELLEQELGLTAEMTADGGS